MPKELIGPFLAGVFMGIAVGSGVIIDASSKGDIKKLDLFRLGLFLSIFHGIITDTLIFAIIGANFFRIVYARLILAIFVLFLFEIVRKHMKNANFHK